MSTLALSVLRRQRTIERKSIDATGATVNSFGALSATNRNEIVRLLTTMNRRLAHLRELDTKIVAHADMQAADVDNELQAAAEHSDGAMDIIAELERLIADAAAPPPAPSSTGATAATAATATTSSAPQIIVAGPPLDTTPEVFDGSRLQYRSFRAQFDNWIARRSSSSDVDKLVALRKLLRGPPKDLIEPLLISDVNYQVALRMLDANFGHVGVERQRVLASLHSLPVVRSMGDTAALRDLLNKIQSAMMAMEGLGCPLQTYALLFNESLRAAVPHALVSNCEQYERMLLTVRSEQPGASVADANGNDADRAVTQAVYDVRALVDFVSKHTAQREVAGLYERREDKADGGRRPLRHYNGPPPKKHASTVAATSASKQQHKRTFRPCLFCKDPEHSSSRCAAALTIEQRHQILDKQKRCRLCFRAHKTAAECTGPNVDCQRCHTRNHYTCMHPPNQQVTAATSSGNANASHGCALLQMASAYLVFNGQRTPVRIFLDAGSTTTFVSPRAINMMPGIRPLYRVEMSIQTLDSTQTVNPLRYKVQLQSTHNDAVKIDLLAFEQDIKVHPASERSPAVTRALQRFNADHPLADRALTGDLPDDAPVMLVGIDQYYKLAHLGREKAVCEGIVAKDTRLGWIVGGPAAAPHVAAQVNYVQVHCCAATLSKPAQDVQRLWTLEAIGVDDSTKPQLTADEEDALRQFDASVRYDGHHYTVAMPKRSSIVELSNNKSVATTRLQSKLNSLRRHPPTYERYHSEVMSFVDEGHAEEVLDFSPDESDVADGTYFMPHHQVVTRTAEKEKWRIVFDCSASAAGQSSLNSHLLTGPNVNPDLVELLLNFRLHDVALSADITRAYMRISLDAADRPLFRFLWRGPDDSGTRCYQMKKVTWGAAPSGFLLAATLRELFRRVDPQSQQRIGASLYHDDLLRSFATAEEATAFIDQVVGWLGSAGMELAKWKTNSAAVVSHLRGIGAESPSLDLGGGAVLKVLGIAWCPSDDKFRFPLDQLVNEATSLTRITKRIVLRIVASIFDPIGWLLPFVLRGKLLIQKLWSKTLKWDELVTDELLEQFTGWTAELSDLLPIRVARQYATGSSITARHLHIFGDASESAYAAAAYLQTYFDDDSSCCSLVMAKSRLAPKDKQTMPRLELLAALLAIRLRAFITDKLQIAVDRVFFYTDSTVTYYWCTADQPGRWKPFVFNRVREIQQHSTPSEWYHVPGEHNIADFATRGVAASELAGNSCWWTGPQWLQLPLEQRPPSQLHSTGGDSPDLNTVAREMRVTAAATAVSAKPLVDLSRFSSFDRAVRVVANVMSFCYRSRPTLETPTEADLLRAAEVKIIRWTQQQHFAAEITSARETESPSRGSKLSGFSLFIDDDGLLRARTRLTLGPKFTHDEKNPIVIPGESRLATLLILHHHRINAHFGVNTILSALRRRFWVTRARQVIKSLLRSCVTCRRAHGRPADQVRAPLPAERVTLLTPFSTTGVDYCGPFYTRDGEKTTKSYIALFTCASIRAVHLELVPSMTTPQTHLAIRRFLSVHAGCQHFISDNGRSFVRAATDIKKLFNSAKDVEVKQLLAKHRITWQFICPRAPWHGGFYERLVGTVKMSLTKTLGCSLIGFEELRTIIAELAAVINSRPLSYVSGDLDGPTPLTPAHLLFGGPRPAPLCIAVPLDTMGPNGATTDTLRAALLEKTNYFKSASVRWHREYLLQLRSANQADDGRPRPARVGDVCLLKDDNRPRVKWDLIRIEDAHPGRDGAVRTYSVKFANGHVSRRAAQLLYPLEVV